MPIDKKSLTKELKSWFGCWDKDVPEPVYLIPLAIWEHIPNGTEVASAFDKGIAVKGIDSIDKDTRFGRMSYGFTDKLFAKLNTDILENLKFQYEGHVLSKS